MHDKEHLGLISRQATYPYCKCAATYWKTKAIDRTPDLLTGAGEQKVFNSKLEEEEKNI